MENIEAKLSELMSKPDNSADPAETAYQMYRSLRAEDRESADQWLHKAAELGSRRARHMLENRERRRNAPPEKEKPIGEMSLIELSLTAKCMDAAGQDSLPYHRRAAELGSEISRFLLNLPDPKDRLNADMSYVNHCEDTCWEYAMADLYYWGFGPDELGKDVDKAFGYFMAAASQGCDDALRDMVEFYWDTRRAEVEKYLFDTAFGGGAMEAFILYEKLQPESPEEARRCLKLAASLGCEDARTVLEKQ